MSPIMRLPLGPSHSTCNAKVAPSRFLLRIVHRPKRESISLAVIFTRGRPEFGAVAFAYLIFRIRSDQREVVCAEHRRYKGSKHDNA